MEMKVNSPLIKKLREDRSWSQEHLAEIAGLSARTIQRVETEGKASPETKMAIAAVFGLDVSALNLAEAAPDLPPAALAAGGTAASAAGDASTSPRNRLLRHAAVFLLVCAGLVLLDVSRHGDLTWSRWPLLGWGLGLLLHWFRTRGTAPAAKPGT